MAGFLAVRAALTELQKDLGVAGFVSEVGQRVARHPRSANQMGCGSSEGARG
jgi:hypothetical protein